MIVEAQMNTITKYARNAQDVLRKTGRSSRVVGYGNPPLKPYYQDGYRLEILESESTTPSEVKERVNILRKSGVRFSHVLIAHEQPKPLKKFEIPKEVIDAARNILPVLGAVLWALASVVGAVLIVMGRIFLFCLTLDPVVIVVLDDGTWLEIAKWYN